MAKRTLDGFFSSAPKKPRIESAPVASLEKGAEPSPAVPCKATNHPTYPWPVPHLPAHISPEVELLVTAQGKEIKDQPHLDLLYFQPFIPKTVERDLFNFLRSELFFYRVKYTIKRFGKETLINTPRFTTVFGLDGTSRFADGGLRIVDASDPVKTVSVNKYHCKPRPIPDCLDFLRRVTEANTDTRYNFCLVNYVSPFQSGVMS